MLYVVNSGLIGSLLTEASAGSGGA